MKITILSLSSCIQVIYPQGEADESSLGCAFFFCQMYSNDNQPSQDYKIKSFRHLAGFLKNLS